MIELPTVDLSAGAERCAGVRLVLPDRPDAEWFFVAVPVPIAELDDPAITPRQVTVDAQEIARDTLDRILYPLVVERRRDNRGAAA